MTGFEQSRLLTRTFGGLDLEVRAEAGGRTLVGIAVPFDRVTEVAGRHGSYRESFRRGSFTRTISERGPAAVKLLSAHDDRSNPIGRATLLREDAAGLYAEFKVSATRTGDEVLELVRDGALDGLSVGFVPVTHIDHREHGLVERTEVKLREVSVVAWPAYQGARILALRSATRPADFSLDLARRRTALAAALTGAPRDR